jgi:hypothetical protein
MCPRGKVETDLTNAGDEAMRSTYCGLSIYAAILLPSLHTCGEDRPPQRASIRVATYNVAFYRDRQGQLIEDLNSGDEQARSIAEVIQRVQPDILLLNEFDYVAGHTGPIKYFYCHYLLQPTGDLARAALLHSTRTPVNTGVASGMDLDGDGQSDGPGDALGWGRYPGQYGMAVYSRFPIIRERMRTFQKFLWKDMPGAKLPTDPESGDPYYDSAALEVLRLSSKSHWDVPIEVTTAGQTWTLHLLCSHPTPPVFDGPEDRNGRRNHDEIRLWADYIDAKRSNYLVDDHGLRGGLAPGQRFIVLGDLNADSVDGDAGGANIAQLLNHPSIQADVTPASEGAAEASTLRPDLNAEHKGDPKFDTADFSGDGQGNLRVDYVLPSRNLEVTGAGVFWPKQGEPGSAAIRATDHRLVWMDVALPAVE